jgi:hypothetical protein
MPDLILTQADADALIAMEKQRVDDNPWDYPGLGGSICVPLISLDRRESFLLDVSRGRLDLLKGTYQNRARQIVVLVRLDFGGQPHRNPDDVEVPSPHLHILGRVTVTNGRSLFLEMYSQTSIACGRL